MKAKPFTLTKPEINTIWAAMDDAIRDRELFVDAYTPKYSKPDKDAVSIIRQTKRRISKYRAMQDRIRKHFAETQAAEKAR